MKTRLIFALCLTMVLLLSPLSGTQSRAFQSPPSTNLVQGADPNDLFIPVTARQFSQRQTESLDNLLSAPTAAKVNVVQVQFDLLRDAQTINLELFDKNLQLATDRIEERAQQDYSWFGVDPATQSHAILVVQGDEMVGTIRFGGQMYRVRPLGDGLHALIRVDESAFPDDHPAEYRELEEATTGLSGNETGTGSTDPQSQSLSDNSSIIKVIVAYTAAAKSQAGNIDALIQLAIDETNQSYANSGISPRVQLVYKYQTDYTESTSIATDRNRFQTDNDNYMDEIHNLRDAYAADIAVLIAHDYGSVCGIAAAIMANTSTAFAVVAQDCATGYYSFGHEIGHLQGARHNPEADPNTTPFAYGHGYYYQPERWRTVMSYNCPVGCTRLQYWSTPNVNYNGVPMGTAATHHNVRVLNETAYTVANFKTTPKSTDDAQFVAQSVPTTLQAGESRTVWIEMKNIGSTTWTRAGGYKLGSQNPPGNTTWGLSRVELSASDSIETLDVKRFTFTITAPSQPGTYDFQWSMLKEGVWWFGQRTPNVQITVQGPTNNAQFISQSVPTSLCPGESRTVWIKMKNNGGTTWTRAQGYKLGSQNPQGNTTWSLNRVQLSSSDSIKPGQTKQFTFNVTAPTTPGYYNFQWRMLQEQVEWFGQYTSNVRIQVKPMTNNAQFISQSVPTSLNPGQTRSVWIKVKNTGCTTWTRTENYKLGSQNPPGNTTWGLKRVWLSPSDSIKPGQTKQFSFNITAPTTPGYYNFQWRMLRELVEWFGQYTSNVEIKVGNP